ncbi:MAG: biotin/lipoyl-binding protein, partial [Planctomycetota bacterium]|nr:biotin/lipoyl-binding protein [Planctomycetota bacterium]
MAKEPREFRLPELGENIETGDVVSLLVSEGDEIRPEQNVVELETEKAVVEVPCPHAGRVEKIHVKLGDRVAIGDVILTLDESAGNGAGTASTPETATPETATPETATPETATPETA